MCLILIFYCKKKKIPDNTLQSQFLFDPSGVSRGGDDSIRSSDLHAAGGCGFCIACGQMALPTKECLGWLLFHSGTLFFWPFFFDFKSLLRSAITI